MKGFKAFDKDLKCRGMQFEIGKTFTVEGDLKICSNGLHFCEKLESVYGYYDRSSDTRICEVEVVGPVQTEGDKSAALSLKIVRELSHKEMLDAILKGNNSGDYNSGNCNSGDCNSGNYNSGNYNSGNYNSGNCNSGYYNSGNYNSGNYNSGYRNSGNYNSGNYNSGYRNSGYYNSGNYNSGYRNSGYCNSGNYNSGIFNTHKSYVTLFNKNSKLKWDDPSILKLTNELIPKIKPILSWVCSENMTETEKSEKPSHKTTGGFLRKTDRFDYSAWNNKADIEFLKSLPNFNSEILKQITGLDV